MINFINDFFSYVKIIQKIIWNPVWIDRFNQANHISFFQQRNGFSQIGFKDINTSLTQKISLWLKRFFLEFSKEAILGLVIFQFHKYWTFLEIYFTLDILGLKIAKMNWQNELWSDCFNPQKSRFCILSKGNCNFILKCDLQLS